eukprot:759497-Hanusia_phi.AAC.4
MERMGRKGWKEGRSASHGARSKFIVGGVRNKMEAGREIFNDVGRSAHKDSAIERGRGRKQKDGEADRLAGRDAKHILGLDIQQDE